ncbi:tol-pal system-associated acyl-CoA thioesterase [endosymbiont of Lamellibrachia barhami]|uniref:tol-pal system-associated acyl-CoA thioesterase n=1 Tax=endosymbiont of Lamellibrachia barhami TaxID=205975 RepID=UPI0015AE0AFB
MNEFLWPVRVYYEDTDSGGVVYYANYLKFMERTRTEWLRSLGFEQDRMLQQDGVIFAVVQVEVSYLRPARFNDALEVSARITRRGRASLTFYQEVRRLSDNTKLVSGRIKVACVDAVRMRPAPLPENLFKEIAGVG